MNEPTDTSIIAEADRLWYAAWTLDDLLGTTNPSEYVADCVRKLWHDGRGNDVAEVSALADRLEARVFELTERGRVATGPKEATG